ncbi:MAG TPA: histidine kinase [Terriglobales bacterium]|nr:histidine kinase [Terriglobales bacterium]
MSQKFFSRDPTPWWHYLISWLVGVYLWALLMPGILWLGRRFPIERRNWVRRVALHLLLGVVVTLVQLILESAILSHLGVFPGLMNTFVTTFAFLLVIGFHTGIMTYWEVLGVQYGIGYYQNYQERKQEALRLELRASGLQSQLVQAQLGVLKMQLQPHFLFNTLNAIMVLVRQQKSKEAEQTLAHLSDLLRCVLEDVEAQEVPLRRELEYLQLYLSIEQVRFQDRLRVEISADPAILDAALPQMVLQPVVENAIRHGVGKSAAAGRIKISAVRLNDTLKLSVQDDGPGFSSKGPVGKHSTGIGLANTRARLKQLYGEEAQLNTGNGEPRGAMVTITIPYHVVPGTFETEVMELHALHDANR